MLLKVTFQPAENDYVKVDFSFGLKAARGPSYITANRGMVEMKDDEWAVLREILSRGAKRPTTVVIEQAG